MNIQSYVTWLVITGSYLLWLEKSKHARPLLSRGRVERGAQLCSARLQPHVAMMCKQTWGESMNIEPNGAAKKKQLR